MTAETTRVASAVATTREDWQRGHTNAALAELEADIAAATGFYLDALHGRAVGTVRTRAQVQADRIAHASMVDAACDRLCSRLAQIGGAA